MYPKKITIEEGSDADLVIVDLDLEQRITSEILQSVLRLYYIRWMESTRMAYIDNGKRRDYYARWTCE